MDSIGDLARQLKQAALARDDKQVRSLISRIIDSNRRAIDEAVRSQWLLFEREIESARFAGLTSSVENALLGLKDADPLVRACALFVLVESFHVRGEIQDELRRV